MWLMECCRPRKIKEVGLKKTNDCATTTGRDMQDSDHFGAVGLSDKAWDHVFCAQCRRIKEERKSGGKSKWAKNHEYWR